MNKRQGATIKTPYHNQPIHTLLSIFFAFKTSKSVRRKYNINVHCISVLVACYLYTITVNPLFGINKVALYYGVYSYYVVKKYFIVLESIGLITQRGVNKYSMTDKGIDAINEISHNSESLIYEFCNKYNLEL